MRWRHIASLATAATVVLGLSVTADAAEVTLRLASVGNAETTYGQAQEVLKQELEQALWALGPVELAHLASRPYSDLSGGQRRRVLVARALCAKPSMLILDEPAANMDKESERRLYATLANLKGETTILIVTHDMRQVSDLTDRVFCIDAHKQGKVGRTVVQHALEDYEDGTKRIRHDVHLSGDQCQKEGLDG